MALHIVLFEPEIPQNTGNIARTCAVVGASLDLVYPLGFSIDEKHVKRAGLDYWDKLNITKWKSIDEFMEAKKGERLFMFTTKAPKSYHQADYTGPGDIYLIFGKETKGIPEQVLVDNEESCVKIPMREETRSLNLSNSVAIAAYEVLRQLDFPGLSEKGHLHNLHWKDEV
ncbi:MAG: tRNA (cytidine(34)-2'-O)-methyltransferase [Sphaerochaeta sp.]|jgi:tRNA (cytidine/uridine-2'-O-)-methyltransferase